MLKTTFTSYKERFKEFMGVMKMVIVLEIFVAVLGIVVSLFVDRQIFLVIALASLAMAILSVIQWLIYVPGVFRTIQKREIGEAITIEQANNFQKVNKWNYFMLSFWTFVYTLKFGLFSALPIAAGILIGFLLMGFGPVGLIAGTLVMAAGCAYGLYLAYKNIPKVFFPLNIYFVKNAEPKECVNESMSIGTTHRNTIWKFILGLAVINLIGLVLVLIPEFFTSEPFSATENPPMTIARAIIVLWQTLVGLLFISPMTYLYMSKAYAKIRAISEPALPHVVVSPEVVQ